MTKSVADLHEDRLLQSAADARKLLVALLLFALAILGAGAVRLNQAQAIEAELGRYEAALPKDWEPLESFYDRSAHMLGSFAERESTPWSRGFIVMVTYFTALGERNPNATVEKTLERYSRTGKALHQYNSDIRTITAAQRRNLGFRQLSSRELKALERVVRHKLTPDQSEVLKEAPKTAALFLHLSSELQKKPFPPGRSETDKMLDQILLLRKAETRQMLEDIAGKEGWSDAAAKVLIDDLYYSRATADASNFQRLRDDIEKLPKATITAAEARRDELESQKQALARDAGLELPLLGVRVAAAHVTLAVAIINAILVGTICVLLFTILGELAGLKRSAPEQSAAAHGLMVADIAIRKRASFGAALLGFALVSPSPPRSLCSERTPYVPSCRSSARRALSSSSSSPGLRSGSPGGWAHAPLMSPLRTDAAPQIVSGNPKLTRSKAGDVASINGRRLTKRGSKAFPGR